MMNFVSFQDGSDLEGSQIISIYNRSDLRALLWVCLLQDLTVVDAEGDIRVRSTSTEFDPLDTSRSHYSDLEKPNGCVQRCARQELLEIKGEDVGFVHHRSKNTVDGLTNKTGQTRYLSKVIFSIKTQCS